MLTIAILVYAGVAYWLFWHGLYIHPGDTGAIVVVRCAIYLVVGPLMFAGLWAAVAVNEIAYARKHARGRN